MRKDIERIYGAELRWLRSRSRADKWRIGWFVASMCLVMMAGGIDGSIYKRGGFSLAVAQGEKCRVIIY